MEGEKTACPSHQFRTTHRTAGRPWWHVVFQQALGWVRTFCPIGSDKLTERRSAWERRRESRAGLLVRRRNTARQCCPLGGIGLDGNSLERNRASDRPVARLPRPSSAQAAKQGGACQGHEWPGRENGTPPRTPRFVVLPQPPHHHTHRVLLQSPASASAPSGNGIVASTVRRPSTLAVRSSSSV